MNNVTPSSQFYSREEQEMFNARRSAFLEKMAFGEQQTRGESPPRLKDLLVDAGWMMVVTAYMVAVVLLVGWAFGH